MTLTIPSGSTTNIKISLLGAVASMHDNSMGQRTIFPELSCEGTACTVVALLNARVSPFMVYVIRLRNRFGRPHA